MRVAVITELWSLERTKHTEMKQAVCLTFGPTTASVFTLQWQPQASGPVHIFTPSVCEERQNKPI